MSDLILYTSEDGNTRVQLRVEGQTIWLTQHEIAELFQTTPQNITIHIRSIYDDEELPESATCKESLQVRLEGDRKVQRSVKLYNLDLILAIGYRVRSPRGTQFRQWATTHLREYLVKGFVMDDERLKNPGRWDYFDELLARIREIRASEKRFYQKVRDLFALSSDYKIREEETNLFFAEVQNKLLCAATGNTAAELIVKRADLTQPNMALTNWSGSRVRKQDVIIAKNYLTKDEINTLSGMRLSTRVDAKPKRFQQKLRSLSRLSWRGSWKVKRTRRSHESCEFVCAQRPVNRSLRKSDDVVDMQAKVYSRVLEVWRTRPRTALQARADALGADRPIAGH